MSSKTIEIEEKTIDIAIEKACRDFGVPREKLNIEIISEGSNGFLGLMAKKAKIRASLFSLDMDFSLDDSDRPVRHEVPDEDKPNFRPDSKSDIKSKKKVISRRETPADRKFEIKPEIKTKTERRMVKTASKTTGNVISSVPETTAASAAHEKSPALTLPAVKAVAASTPSALKAQELLSGILNRMTFECQVTAMETDDTIILSIAGDESGLLIGRRGQNLDALQYLLNKSINKSESERKMIVVDSEDYRKRREESLLSMAERIRDKVKKTQKPLSLSHMNAHDRRIIHLALQEDESLVTKSRGEGEYRKVVVLPARKRNSGGNKSRSRQ